MDQAVRKKRRPFTHRTPSPNQPPQSQTIEFAGREQSYSGSTIPGVLKGNLFGKTIANGPPHSQNLIPAHHGLAKFQQPKPHAKQSILKFGKKWWAKMSPSNSVFFAPHFLPSLRRGTASPFEFKWAKSRCFVSPLVHKVEGFVFPSIGTM
ncbi:hypothetical protein [Rubripirellula obstinata]|uniref:hypothetical protein n=1 Tax=Rubripirellula obstinata TaxID=406547 RepID=UPI00083154D9|nr:hypothetical protein [Rubripirellula obstinata]